MKVAADIRGESISIDSTPADEIRGYLEAGFASQLFNPLEDPTASQRLLDLRADWRAIGATVVFTTGVFDVLHANHRGYLLATRLSAVASHFIAHEADGEDALWDTLDTTTRREYASHVLSNHLIKQVVSVDGDDAVAERKGFSASKGNMARPVYGWESRARDVLSASYTAPDGSGARFLADAVTIHDRVEPTFANSMHAGIMDIGYGLAPDVWAIFHESQDILDELQQDRQCGPGHSAAIRAIIIRNSDRLYSDSKLGGPFSTTALAARIGGSALPNAV